MNILLQNTGTGNKIVPTRLNRIFSVWRRNAVVYFKTWKINFLPSLLEPLLYFAGFGLGLSGLVKNISYAGRIYSYPEFISSGIIIVSGMNNAFFENTYGTYIRMYYQKIFEAMMAAVLTPADVILGEIMWGTFKAVISSLIVFLVVGIIGVTSLKLFPVVLLVSFLTGICFSVCALFFTAIMPSIDNFNLPIFLFITPMFLFSGVFFPLDIMPQAVRVLALFLPLTHLVMLFRYLAAGALELKLLWSLAYIMVFTGVFYVLATKLMKNRLIK